MPWRPLLLAVLTATAALTGVACGGSGGGDAGTVTGRVMSVDRSTGRVCVSPDRGASATCVDVADPASALAGVEVGGCAVADPAGDRVAAADEPACAAGDVGD